MIEDGDGEQAGCVTSSECALAELKSLRLDALEDCFLDVAKATFWTNNNPKQFRKQKDIL